MSHGYSCYPINHWNGQTWYVSWSFLSRYHGYGGPSVCFRTLMKFLYQNARFFIAFKSGFRCMNNSGTSTPLSYGSGWLSGSGSTRGNKRRRYYGPGGGHYCRIRVSRSNAGSRSR